MATLILTLKLLFNLLALAALVMCGTYLVWPGDVEGCDE